jgi:hypothetical protein
MVLSKLSRDVVKLQIISRETKCPGISQVVYFIETHNECKYFKKLKTNKKLNTSYLTNRRENIISNYFMLVPVGRRNKH